MKHRKKRDVFVGFYIRMDWADTAAYIELNNEEVEKTWVDPSQLKFIEKEDYIEVWGTESFAKKYKIKKERSAEQFFNELLTEAADDEL